MFQIPKGLPYFTVEFGLDGGYAHVIENEEMVPHYFGKVHLLTREICFFISINSTPNFKF